MDDKEFANFVAGTTLRMARAIIEIAIAAKLTNEQSLTLFEKIGDELRALPFDFKAGIPPATSARATYERIYGDGEKETN